MLLVICDRYRNDTMCTRFMSSISIRGTSNLVRLVAFYQIICLTYADKIFVPINVSETAAEKRVCSTCCQQCRGAIAIAAQI